MKFIWTNNKKWIQMGGPWLGSWDVKMAPLCMGIGGIVFILGILFSIAIIRLKNPIEVIIEILQTKDIDMVLARGVLILIPVSLILGSLVACINTRWFKEKNIIIVYDEAVYVHDPARGGILLKRGQIKTLVIVDDNCLMFHLKKMKRGIKYMKVVLDEPIPKEILKKIIEILKPEKTIKLEMGRKGLLYPMEVIVYLLHEKNPKLVKEFVKRDYTKYWDPMRKIGFCPYGWHLAHLFDTLIALGMKKEALAIALAPAYLSLSDYIKGIRRGLSWILRSKWRYFLMTAPQERSPIDLDFIFIVLPLCFLLGLVFVAGIVEIIHVSEQFLLIATLGSFFFAFAAMYWDIAIPYYNSVVYFQAGRKSLVFFILRVFVDVIVVTFFYFLFLNWLHPLFYVVFLFSSIFYACAISGIYVFLNAPEIGSSIARELFKINPDFEKIVDELLKSS